MHRLATIGVLAIVLTGCSGALHDQWAAAPHGQFGATASNTDRAATPDAPDAPTLDGADSSGVVEDAERAPAFGPVTAEELESLRVTSEAVPISTVQDPEWSPTGDALEHDVARAAFLARNNAVAAAVKRHRASRTRYDQVDYLNDLVRQYDAFAEGMMTDASTPHVMPQRPSWPLRGPGRLQTGIAEVDVAVSFVRLEEAVLAELVTFEDAYHSAVYWAEAAASYRATRSQARKSARVAETNYRSGRGTYFHVLMAENRVDLLDARADSAEERAQAERETLAALLELPADTLDDMALEVPAPPPLPDRDALTDQVLETSPALAAARLTARRAELMVELVERQVLPELSPEIRTTRTGEVPKRGGRDLMYATRAPFLAELTLVAEATETALDSAARRAPAAADVRWAELSDALRNLRLSRGSLRSRARKARNAASDGFRAGQVTFAELDDAVTQVLEIDLAEHSHRRAAAIAATKLEVVLGTGASRRAADDVAGPAPTATDPSDETETDP